MSPTLQKRTASGAGCSAPSAAGLPAPARARIIPKAATSTPTGSRPARRSGSRKEAIMLRRAATTTTSICGAVPSSPGTPPMTWCSSTAWSSGIGICSWAWKRMAASSCFGSSIAGSRRVRTTIRWLPTPSRTCFESLWAANRDFSEAASASGSTTSPSPKAPGGRGSTAARLTETAPFTFSSVGAMLPASMSRPTMSVGFFGLTICIGIRTVFTPVPHSIDRKPPELSSCNYRFLGERRRLGEGAQIPVDKLVPEQKPNQRTEGQEGTERDCLLTGRRTLASDQRQPDHGTCQQGDEQSGGDVAAEEETHYGGELDVTEAHPSWVEERCDEEQPACGHGGDRPFRQARRIADDDYRESDQRRGQEDFVRDDSPLEIGDGHRH